MIDWKLLIATIIVFIVGIIAFVYFNNFRKDNCKNNGGMVVENEIGIFEKCIR